MLQYLHQKALHTKQSLMTFIKMTNLEDSREQYREIHSNSKKFEQEAFDRPDKMYVSIKIYGSQMKICTLVFQAQQTAEVVKDSNNLKN